MELVNFRLVQLAVVYPTGVSGDFELDKLVGPVVQWG